MAEWWDRIPRRTKIGAGATLGAGSLLAGGVAMFSGAPSSAHYADYAAGEFDYDTGVGDIYKNSDGEPAILSYLQDNDSDVLTISMASELPSHFIGNSPEARHLAQVEINARSSWTETHMRPVTSCSTDADGNQSCSTHMESYTETHYRHYDYPLEIQKDFRAITESQAQQVMEYFEEFTRVTGIEVDVQWDNPHADITIANYYNEPDSYRGSLDYVNPNEIASLPPSADAHGFASGHGFVILDQRDYGRNINLGSAIGKALGFDSTDVNIAALREALRNYRQEVPGIATGNTTYPLDGNLSPWSDLIPSDIIIDNGGENTVRGSADNDLLLTEEGKCGYTDIPKTRVGSVFGDGDRYCIAEGEVAVVQAGEGNDYIIAAAGDTQRIQPGAGEDEILFYENEIGEKLILAEAGEDIESHNTLVLHRGLLERTEISASLDGELVQLVFTAASGRQTGSITLEPDAVQRFLVIGDQTDEIVFEADVSGFTSPDEWLENATRPAAEAVHQLQMEEAKAELDTPANQNEQEETAWADRLQRNATAATPDRSF